MANKGKIEGLITVPAGGWSAQLTDSLGGPTTVTVPAGTYYPSVADSGARGLAAELESQADAAMGQDWNVILASGEGGTGKTTINCVGGTCTVIWTDTDLRDALGFTANLSGSTGYTSPNQARCLWMPDGYPIVPFDLDDYSGIEENDLIATEAPGGQVYVVGGQTKHALDVTWTGVSHAKTRIAAETTVNESFEKFRNDCIVGAASFTTPGGPLAVWMNAGSSASNIKFRISNGEQLSRFTAEQLDATPGALRHWNIRLDRLVKIPS